MFNLWLILISFYVHILMWLFKIKYVRKEDIFECMEVIIGWKVNPSSWLVNLKMLKYSMG